MKGTTIILNRDPWTVVDVAPAEPLAEMVAALLEEEGFVTAVRGIELLGDTLAPLGVGTIGAAVVLVPQADAEAALALIAETVTDYEGEDLDAVLARLAEDPHALDEEDAGGSVAAGDGDDDAAAGVGDPVGAPLDGLEDGFDDPSRALDELEGEVEETDDREPSAR